MGARVLADRRVHRRRIICLLDECLQSVCHRRRVKEKREVLGVEFCNQASEYKGCSGGERRVLQPVVHRADVRRVEESAQTSGRGKERKTIKREGKPNRSRVRRERMENEWAKQRLREERLSSVELEGLSSVLVFLG